MSGECDKCGENTLECTCGSLRANQRNDRKHNVSLINQEPIPLGDGENPPAEQLLVKYINVRGRVEYEALIKDSAKCKEL
jgi:hypothetical protein